MDIPCSQNIHGWGMSICESFFSSLDPKLEMHQSWLVNPTPPQTYPPSEIRCCLGIINHWFLLIRFQRGGVRWWGVGWLAMNLWPRRSPTDSNPKLRKHHLPADILPETSANPISFVKTSSFVWGDFFFDPPLQTSQTSCVCVYFSLIKQHPGDMIGFVDGDVLFSVMVNHH